MKMGMHNVLKSACDQEILLTRKDGQIILIETALLLTSEQSTTQLFTLSLYTGQLSLSSFFYTASTSDIVISVRKTLQTELENNKATIN